MYHALGPKYHDSDHVAKSYTPFLDCINIPLVVALRLLGRGALAPGVVTASHSRLSN